MNSQSSTKRLLMLPALLPVHREWARRLRDKFPHELDVIEVETDHEVQSLMSTADAACGTLTPELLAQADRLRWLHSPLAAPPAGYFSPELIAHPLTVTNVRGIFNDHISAHILSFVLAFARALHHYVPLQQQRVWQQLPRYEGTVHLPEAVALIVGVGGIGAETARLLSAFSVECIGVDPQRTEPPEGMKQIHSVDALDELLPRADFVIVTVPHTPQTERMFNRERFGRMKRGAFFINIGRGATTSLDDLLVALREGQLGGAGLDVFEQEPLPPEHPLWVQPGVFITPHVALWGPYYNERRYQILEENCRRFLDGRPLLNVVNKALWY
ncbi:D-2-hydroxyacid dehydrogenase [Methylocella sp. CPCC 101449]|uniref:D-2-hydroxyacid dehydrogenase n=1 Tax=Methylocella sp. CPCC 101449 TaxID=2987531 RepID=UPI00289059E8|nr:D-2-hydroxyacid dehydrogenase [Methylocella sp. CPCC 101449]MDT2019973.1 D-2-hydroxyacid dehydrogenase [Methylocella sp. CPCC 101449]